MLHHSKKPQSLPVGFYWKFKLPKKCGNKEFFIIKIVRQKTDQNTLESLYNPWPDG